MQATWTRSKPSWVEGGAAAGGREHGHLGNPGPPEAAAVAGQTLTDRGREPDSHGDGAMGPGGRDQWQPVLGAGLVLSTTTERPAPSA